MIGKERVTASSVLEETVDDEPLMSASLKDSSDSAQTWCRVLWPTNGLQAWSSSFYGTIDFDIYYRCSGILDADLENEGIKSMVSATLMVGDDWLFLDAVCRSVEILGSRVVDTEVAAASSHVSSTTNEYTFRTPVSIKVESLISSSETTQLALTVSLEIRGIIFSSVIKNISSYYDVNFLKSELTAASPIDVSRYRGRQGFRSQIFFPEYLSQLGIISGLAVVICCDTFKGLTTVNNLISVWKGDWVMLLIVAHPSSILAEDVQNFIVRSCNTAKVGCLLSVHNTSTVENFLSLSALTGRSVNVFYTDVYLTRSMYRRMLRTIHSKMAFNSVMMGSRYMTQYDKCCWGSGVDVSSAVDEFAFSIGYIRPLFTESEQFYSSNSSFPSFNQFNRLAGDLTSVDKQYFYFSEFSPAWYFIL
jgi:hypothetical protein